METIDPLTLPAYVALTRRLGGDLWLSQGASGNTAVKQGDRMAIKATRTRLIDMTEKTGWVAVDLARLRHGFEKLWAGAATPSARRQAVVPARSTLCCPIAAPCPVVRG